MFPDVKWYYLFATSDSQEFFEKMKRGNNKVSSVAQMWKT